MVREMEAQDLDAVMTLWLAGNLQAHGFIPAQYWKEHYEPVKQLLPQAEILIYASEATGQVEGFVGLMGDEVAGLFVEESAQSQGVGAQLMNSAKARRDQLSLSVYRKNARALAFYQREGFSIQQERLDPDTGAGEYRMLWTRPPVDQCGKRG